MKVKYQCNGLDSYEIEAWIIQLGSIPVELIIKDDRSKDYDMTRATIVRLENNKYALITESGCSCYSVDEAEIELFPNLWTVQEAFKKWCNNHK